MFTQSETHIKVVCVLAQASTHIEAGRVYPSRRTYEVCVSLSKQAHMNRLRVSAQVRTHI